MSQYQHWIPDTGEKDTEVRTLFSDHFHSTNVYQLCSCVICVNYTTSLDLMLLQLKFTLVFLPNFMDTHTQNNWEKKGGLELEQGLSTFFACSWFIITGCDSVGLQVLLNDLGNPWHCRIWVKQHPHWPSWPWITQIATWILIWSPSPEKISNKLLQGSVIVYLPHCTWQWLD